MSPRSQPATAGGGPWLGGLWSPRPCTREARSVPWTPLVSELLLGHRQGPFCALLGPVGRTLSRRREKT